MPDWHRITFHDLLLYGTRDKILLGLKHSNMHASGNNNNY